MPKIGITDIPGFRIGQAQDRTNGTGCTVIVCESSAICGVEVRGGSHGNRETDGLDPRCRRQGTHAVLLSGGSAFGLDTASGVMSFLEEREIGFNVDVARIPSVCCTVLFDLKCGDSKIRPNVEMGYRGTQNAFSESPFQSGNFGAGTGATVGHYRGPEFAMKGGIGAATFQAGDLKVGAAVAVNCLGDVIENGKIIAGTRAEDGVSFAVSETLVLQNWNVMATRFSAHHTVIGCVITNAKLDKVATSKIARQGQNGLANVVRPPHGIFDGDTMFAMSYGEVVAGIDAVGILARRSVEEGIYDGVKAARSFAGFPSINDD
jgi:L-aminopeptidase/D-esterase-like protein